MKFSAQDVNLSKEDKVLFPNSGYTKGDLISYYRNVSEIMIMYALDHPVTLHRFPNGIDNKEFLQKNVSAYFPDWIPRLKVEKHNGFVDMAMINNSETLVYLTNQGTIAYHTWLSRKGKLHYPDRMIIDLDPSNEDFGEVSKAAKMIRNIYNDLELPCFLMTTGSKGLHIVTPLQEKESFVEVKSFAKGLCTYISTLCPKETTIEIRKEKRKGRVFLDYLRNTYAQTGVAPYSVRAKENAPVATPLFCEELDDKNLHSQVFNIKNLLKRLDKKGDPWEGFFDKKYSIRQLSEKLGAIKEENKKNHTN